MWADWKDDDPCGDHWMCSCGNFVEDGMHCDICGCEPPWGCPCEGCQSAGWDDEEEYEEFYHGSLDY
jgi:hypothetical protein